MILMIIKKFTILQKLIIDAAVSTISQCYKQLIKIQLEFIVYRFTPYPTNVSFFVFDGGRFFERHLINFICRSGKRCDRKSCSIFVL